MKAVKWFCVLMALAILFCTAGCGAKDSAAEYNARMSGLDQANANGKLIAGYDVKAGKYITKYIPENLLAQKPEETGYVLNFDFTAAESKESYLGAYIYGDSYHLQLVECATGEVLAEKTLAPYFPEKVQKDFRASPLSADVTDWISHVYPLWAEGEGPTHDYKDATCQKPKTCPVCDKTEGNVGCHTLSNNKCRFCNQTFRDELDGHLIEWVYNDQDTSAPMTGICSGCGAEFNHEFDISRLARQLISGKWTLTNFNKDGKYVESQPAVTVDINPDKTLVIHAPDGDHAFTWRYFNKHIYSAAYFTASYSLEDANRNSLSLYYSHGSSKTEITISDNTYTLVFQQ